jgi:HAD superfamily hydrolase (TIGR01509 family)
MTEGQAGGAADLALLWDMDGTLIASEKYWSEAEDRVAAAFGAHWTMADSLAVVGNNLTATGTRLQECGVDLPVPEIVDRLLDYVIEQVTAQVPWRPGAVELLAAARGEGVPCALVTSSYRRFADAVVAELPAGTFAVVVAGDELTHGKPDPECYLTAQRRLGVAARHCLILEDSKIGVAAALASGMAVLGVPFTAPLEEAPGLTLRETLAGLTPADLRAMTART